MSSLSSSRPLASRKRPLSPLWFCLGIVVLLLAIIIPFTSYQLFSFARSTLHEARHPHELIHHNATTGADELNLVRSYFGAGEGAATEWDLVASLYFRRDHWMGALSDTLEEGAASESRAPDWSEWQRVHSGVVISRMDGAELMSDKKRGKRGLKGTAKVVLPGAILPFLRQPVVGPYTSHLVSSFYLLPSDRSTTLYPLMSSSPSVTPTPMWNTRLHPELPLPYPVPGANRTAQQPGDGSTDPGWESFLGRSQAVASMLLPFTPKAKGNATAPADITVQDGEGRVDEETEVNSRTPEVVPRVGRAGIWTRGSEQSAKVIDTTWVAMARDESVYSLEGYANKSSQLGAVERNCAKEGMPQAHMDPSCWRWFSDVGHFENLLTVGSAPRSTDGEAQQDPTGYRYAPYLTTTLGLVGPEDMSVLPDAPADQEAEESEEPDFAYDWEISLSTVSPARMVAATTVHMTYELNRDTNPVLQEIDMAKDWRDATRSILSQPTSSRSTHPFLRGFLVFIELPFVILLDLLKLYYWYSRSLSTGIALPARLISTANDILVRVALGFTRGHWTNIGQWLALGRTLALALMQVNVAARVEWQWGGLRGWVPVGFGRRRETRGERRSWRREMQFGWGQRAALFVVTYLISTFFSPPALVSAASTISTPFFSLGLFTKPLTFQAFVDSTSTPIWLSVWIPQFVLNHRLGTYAGTFRPTAYLFLIQHVLDIVPKICAGLGWWGRWATMEEMRCYDLVALVVFAGASWQAATLPSVRQDGEEDDEGDK